MVRGYGGIFTKGEYSLALRRWLAQKVAGILLAGFTAFAVALRAILRTCEAPAEQSAPFVLMSELPDTNWLDYRTRFFAQDAKKTSSRTRHEDIKKEHRKDAPLLWSKWRDSNSRPPVPEQIRHRFLTTFVDFFVLFSPKTVLSDAPRRTVST